MNSRRNGLASSATAPTIGIAAAVIAALVAVIGSAQAAPSSKSYTANVRLTDAAASPSAFTLTVANDTRSRQSLGSVNFTAPAGFTVPTSSQQILQAGNSWTVASTGSAVVTFRASTNADALLPGESVSASVNVSVPSSCASALWQVQAKQSNDFSGQPGNDFQVNPTSDLTPLGSFEVGPEIETEEGGQFIPARLTGTSFTWIATAKDTCGSTKTNYSGATLIPTFLTGATFNPADGLKWDGGVGTVTFTPLVTETGNSLRVTDATTKVTKKSNDFDVADTLCVPNDSEPCRWQDKPGNNPGVIAEAGPPPTGANLGIGFNSSLNSPPRANFSCNNSTTPVGLSPVVNINPRGYPGQFEVSLIYKKSVTGNGPASSFVVCFSKEVDGDEWRPMPNCPAPPPSSFPCVLDKKRTSGGDLLIVLRLTQQDPWTGLG